MYPLALAPVVEVGQDLGPDGLVQLGCVPSDHGTLRQVKQQPPSLEHEMRWIMDDYQTSPQDQEVCT